MPNTMDYDYMIVAKHERLNRLLPLERYNITDEEIDEVRNLYVDINRLVEEKKAMSKWVMPNYGQLVEDSKNGRERLAVYPYPEQWRDRKARWEYITRRTQTMLAYAKIGDMRKL